MGEATTKEQLTPITVSETRPRGIRGLAAQVRRWIRRRGGWFTFGIGALLTFVGGAFFWPSLNLYLERQGWIDWGAQVTGRAVATGAEVATSWPFLLAAGGAVGLLAGRVSTGALGRLRFRQRVANEEEMEAALGLRVIGTIPSHVGPDPVSDHLGTGYTAIGESYEQLRSVLSDSLPSKGTVRLMVTGDIRPCGKSVTALALARSFSAIGNSVLLIDADLRKPSFRGPAGGGSGLSSLLSGQQGLRDHIHKTFEDRLFLLPAGPIPPNPGELLARFASDPELAELDGLFDVIVVDSSGPLSGAVEIARYCGTVLFVHSARQDLTLARQALRPIRAMKGVTVLGILTMASNLVEREFGLHRSIPLMHDA